MSRLQLLDRSARILAAVGFSSLAASCRHDVSAPGTDGLCTTPCVVSTDGSTFLPTFVTIAVGGTVRFEIVPAGDGNGHDVTFRPTASGILPPGTPANIPVTLHGTVDRTFNTAGVFPYDCRVHPGMSGEITVR